MAVCGLLMGDYYRRFQAAKKTKSEGTVTSGYERHLDVPKEHRNFRIFCFAIGLAFTTILIRCIYRYAFRDKLVPQKDHADYGSQST
jgi:hypothetical protein